METKKSKTKTKQTKTNTTKEMVIKTVETETKQTNTKVKKIYIDPDILIEELIAKHPEVMDLLINDYEFYCVSCMMAGFETFREGAQAHGIVGKDFEKMLSEVNELINSQPL